MVALQFDADNSGTINRSEFMTMVHQLKLGDKLFERGVRDIFRKVRSRRRRARRRHRRLPTRARARARLRLPERRL